jgi:hypothetical protein
LLRSASVALPVSGSKRDARTPASRARISYSRRHDPASAGGNFGAIGFQVAVNEIVPAKDEQDKRDGHDGVVLRAKKNPLSGAVGGNLRDLSPNPNSVRRPVYLNAMGEPTDEPTLHAIRDPSVVVVSTDYHIAKGAGRTLAYILDHAVSIRCGHQEVTTVIPSGLPPVVEQHMRSNSDPAHGDTIEMNEIAIICPWCDRTCPNQARAR